MSELTIQVGFASGTFKRVFVVSLILVVAVGFPPIRALGQEQGSRVRSVDVVILSTMLADTRGVGEWGFAALVEADGHRLLFDTGARSETVLKNAQELGVALAGVTEVVLSHHHGDHTGGLLTLRRSWRSRIPAPSRGLTSAPASSSPGHETTAAIRIRRSVSRPLTRGLWNTRVI